MTGRRVRIIFFLTAFCWGLAVLSGLASIPFGEARIAESQTSAGPVMTVDISGPISPATDDFLKTSIRRAADRGARLLVIRLNTPGGLVTSMQSMVQQLLGSPIPTVVFIAPQGAGATSAGVFITMAANIAAMAPGTTIGAAHPVDGNGNDIQGDMREKLENFAVSLIRAIAEQRGRNADWAEKAVRESISVTDRDAVAERVVDLVANDTEQLLEKLEGRTVTVNGQPLTLTGLGSAPREPIEMGLRYKIIAFFTDPTVAVLLSLGAMLGLGIEMYHPGAVLPAVVGIICLVLSLIAGQVLPINHGGVALMVLGAIFFVIELIVPSFGVWGGAGLLCLFLGSIYFVDTDQIWGGGDFGVNIWIVGSIALLIGAILVTASIFVAKAQRTKVTTGREGLIGQFGIVKSGFGIEDLPAAGEPVSSGFGTGSRTGSNPNGKGKIEIRGELWNARTKAGSEILERGQRVKVIELEDGMILVIEAI